jgi:hypothetical protein
VRSWTPKKTKCFHWIFLKAILFHIAYSNSSINEIEAFELWTIFIYITYLKTQRLRFGCKLIYLNGLGLLSTTIFIFEVYKTDKFIQVYLHPNRWADSVFIWNHSNIYSIHPKAGRSGIRMVNSWTLLKSGFQMLNGGHLFTIWKPDRSFLTSSLDRFGIKKYFIHGSFL